jgi:hypothetical protein
MKESLRPQITDFVDNATAAKETAAQPLKIETHANGNPVAREMHPSNELFGEKAARMIRDTGETITEYGKSTEAFLGSAAEKGGELFSSLKERFTQGVKNADTRREQNLNVEQQPIAPGEEVETAKAEIEKSVDESTIAVAQADEKVTEIGHNPTLEKISDGRNAIKGAAEKSTVAGAENFSFGKWLYKKILSIFANKKRTEQLSALKKTAENGSPEDSSEAMSRIALAQKRLEVTESLAEVIHGGTETEPVAAPVTATETAPKMPVLEDKGIEAAFAKKDTVPGIPVLQDKGIEDAFNKKIAAEIDWPPPAANDNEVITDASKASDMPKAA